MSRGRVVLVSAGLHGVEVSRTDHVGRGDVPGEWGGGDVPGECGGGDVPGEWGGGDVPGECGGGDVPGEWLFTVRLFPHVAPIH